MTTTTTVTTTRRVLRLSGIVLALLTIGALGGYVGLWVGAMLMLR